MKKAILFLLLMVGVSTYAQKSYITIQAPQDYSEISNATWLTGDVPDDIDGIEYSPRYHSWYCNGYTTGELLNILSGYGYKVEFMNDSWNFLLSKEIPSGNQTELVGDVNKDSEVTVADVNELVNIILGYVRDNPSLLEELK